MPSGPDLRLKHVGLGLPANYPDVTLRAPEGRPFPADILYGLEGSPIYHRNPDGRVNSSVWRFRINVLDVDRFECHALGFGERGGAGRITRTLPFNDPDGKGMVCVDAEHTYVCESGYNPLTGKIDPNFMNITGRDQASANGEAEVMYRYAIVTLTFAHTPYRIVNDNTAQTGLGERERYTTLMQRAASEYVSLDRAVIYWNDAANPEYIANGNTPAAVATGAGQIRNYTEVVQTWYRIPFDAYVTLLPKWRARLSTVNDATFRLMIFDRVLTFPKETMLFQPWVTREKPDPRGYPEYEIELHWLFRNNGDDTDIKGWNHFLYPPNGQYYRVSWGKGIAPIVPVYPLTDHTEIFAP